MTKMGRQWGKRQDRMDRVGLDRERMGRAGKMGRRHRQVGYSQFSK